MHDDGIPFGSAVSFSGQAVKVSVFPDGWEEVFSLSFQLDPQHHDHIGSLNGSVKIEIYFHSELIKFFREQSRRADKNDPGSHLLQEINVRSCHAAMEDIPDNDDFQVLYFLFFLPYGERIEQSLGGVLVKSISCVDDVGLAEGGRIMRGSGA